MISRMNIFAEYIILIESVALSLPVSNSHLLVLCLEGIGLINQQTIIKSFSEILQRPISWFDATWIVWRFRGNSYDRDILIDFKIFNDTMQFNKDLLC